MVLVGVHREPRPCNVIYMEVLEFNLAGYDKLGSQ